jgi:hypothetical protein
MKGKTTSTLLIITCCFILFACEHPENGFTNKAEAKNEFRDSLKDGKWFEYVDSTQTYTTDTNAPYYSLTIYKTGKRYGIARIYYPV